MDGPGEWAVGGLPVDLCDVCGKVLNEADEQLVDLLPDSSFLHPMDPRLDGRRIVIACDLLHLTQLRQKYERRAFVDAELWAGKLDRVMRQHCRTSRGRLDFDRLGALAGLTFEQVAQALTWRVRQIDMHELEDR